MDGIANQMFCQKGTVRSRSLEILLARSVGDDLDLRRIYPQGVVVGGAIDFSDSVKTGLTYEPDLV